MTQVASLWIGDSLGLIEQASIKSFLHHGYDYTLYVYEKVKNIPDGVIVEDARSIFETDKIIRHKKTGSPAIHADLFRYLLLAKTNNTWVDLDVVAVRKFRLNSEWIFGLEIDTEEYKEANIAVLRLPKSSKTLQSLLTINIDTKAIPVEMRGFRRLKYQIRSLGRGMTIDKWPWGSTGPRALTYYLNKHNELHYALKQSTFYAIELHEAENFLIPHKIDLFNAPDEVWAYHLWGKQLRQILNDKYNNQIPRHSFLDQVLSL